MLIHELLPARRPPRANAYHTLVLHGLGDSMAGWKPAIQMLGLDEMGWIFANAPEEYGPYGGYSWFDILPDMTPDLAGVAASRAMLDELITHLLADLAIPSERLFLLGFSQGCLMSLDLGLKSDQRFAGIIGISGWVADLEGYPSALGTAARQQKILMTHGRFDPMLPITEVRAQADGLRARGIDLTWKDYAKEHSLDPDDEVHDIRDWIRARMATPSTS
jgi:phospholipase/carboxylesterase